MLNTALGGATTAPTPRSRRTVPTLGSGGIPRTTVHTLRPRIFALPASTTSTADVHRIRIACTTFVAHTLARIRIPASAISCSEIPGRDEVRFRYSVRE